MAYNTVKDQQIRGYVSLLRGLLPEHTRTLPRIIVWSVVFLIDLVLGGLAMYYAQTTLGMEPNVAALIFFGVAAGSFGLESVIWLLALRLLR